MIRVYRLCLTEKRPRPRCQLLCIDPTSRKQVKDQDGGFNLPTKPQLHLQIAWHWVEIPERKDFTDMRCHHSNPCSDPGLGTSLHSSLLFCDKSVLANLFLLMNWHFMIIVYMQSSERSSPDNEDEDQRYPLKQIFSS